MDEVKPSEKSVQQAWESWRAGLSPETSSLLGRIQESSDAPCAPADSGKVRRDADEDADAYRCFRNCLTDAGREALDTLPPSELSPEDRVERLSSRYCCIEAPDGEYVVQRVFKSAEALARRLGTLEGQDIVVQAYYGVPLRFTRGPQRYLLLPDGETAMQVPAFQGGLVKSVSVELLTEADVQEDGFLGPLALTDTSYMAEKFAAAGALEVGGTQDEDDEDEDEDDEDDEDEDEDDEKARPAK